MRPEGRVNTVLSFRGAQAKLSRGEDVHGAALPIWTDIDKSCSLKVRTLSTWWDTHCGPSGIPDRKDLDPSELTAILPNMLIAEVETAPFRLRYRLVGTRVVQVAGFDFTGRYLDDLLDASLDLPWLGYYASSYESRTPILGSVTEPTSSGDQFNYEFGLFPLGSGGHSVTQFVSVEDYFNFELTLAGLKHWPSSA